MKKIAGILICIALALAFTGCNWQIPEKVSVKTNAEYNFSLGNFEQDFNKELNLSSMIGNLQLPNNGKVYDYWPEKKGDLQSFLMYMPLQEIPIDISSYFDKGALADKIKEISFEKEFEVPAVSFSFPVTFELSKVNEEINKHFVLAGPINDYGAGEFGSILSQIAESVTYEKGFLEVKAYSLHGVDPSSITSIQDAITDKNDVDTTYNYGRVTITSGGKSISGSFYNGVATLEIPSEGFEFKSNDINISFTDKPNFLGVPLNAFIAQFDTSRPYQIKKVSRLGSSITIPAVSIDEQEFDALESLKTAGVEECVIGEGSIDLDFNIPSEWENVTIGYVLNMQGGINLTSGNCTASSGRDNLNSISLNDVSISTEKIKVNAAVALTVAGATIDFTKEPKISFDSDIKRIKTVTAKLSDTSLSISESQKLPDEVLAILKSLELKKCGIKGTYTNNLPKENNITLNVSSNFFGLSNKAQTIEGGAVNKEFELVTSDEVRTINLTKDNPAPEGKFNAFDFAVNVTLPGGEANKVTIRDVEPGTTYKLAIKVEPVINWEAVTVDTSSLPSTSDKVGTGFNPSTIFNSINNVMGEGFANKISLPDCKLYLYITKPNIDVLDDLNFKNTSISMYYGKSDTDANPRQKIGDFQMDIIKNGKYNDGDEEKSIAFAKAAPKLEKIEKTEVVVKEGNTEKTVTSELLLSKLNTQDASFILPLTELLKSADASQGENSQLCIDYNINLAGMGGTEGFRITKEAFDSATSEDHIGSIGIYALVELPLSFTVEGGTSIDLMSLIKADNSADLFGRSDANSMDQIKEFGSAIETAKIDYTINEFPVTTTDDIKIKLNLGDDQGNGYQKEFAINTAKGSEGSFAIEAADVEQLLNAYPLKLKEAKIVFDNNNTISMPREKTVSVNLQIGIKTNGSIPIQMSASGK